MSNAPSPRPIVPNKIADPLANEGLTIELPSIANNQLTVSPPNFPMSLPLQRNPEANNIMQDIHINVNLRPELGPYLNLNINLLPLDKSIAISEARQAPVKAIEASEATMVVTQRMVRVDTVIKGASSIAAAVSLVVLLATVLSGAIIVQPAIAVLVLMASIGFYFMTMLEK